MGKTVRPERQRESAGGDTGAEHDGGEPGGQPTAGGFEQGDDGMNPIERLGEYVSTDERGVSSVIGVVLMVAVAVILAAVIASFALGIGDQAKDATPSAQFKVDETGETLKWRHSDGGGETISAEFNIVEITHQGGDPIELKNLNVTVNGNPAYDVFVDNNTKDNTFAVKPFSDLVYNGNSKFKAGDSIRVIVYEADSSRGTQYPGDAPSSVTGSNQQGDGAFADSPPSPSERTCGDGTPAGPSGTEKYINTYDSTEPGDDVLCEDLLSSGDTVNLIYEPNQGTPTVLLEHDVVKEAV